MIVNFVFGDLVCVCGCEWVVLFVLCEGILVLCLFLGSENDMVIFDFEFEMFLVVVVCFDLLVDVFLIV